LLRRSEINIAEVKMEAVLTIDFVLKKAIQLKPLERLQPIDALLESLDKPNPPIEKLWIKEADERYQAYQKGELNVTDWEEIKKRYA